MSADRLLAYYEQVADAPDSVARLRCFILDLAVRGKLVPQNTNDEPASELLNRITAEKLRLQKAGEIKADRPSNSRNRKFDEFSLPAGWDWANLKELCISVTDGDHLPPPKSVDGIPFLVIGDVRSKVINYDSERRVPRSYYNALDPIRKPRVGDVLYTLVGSFGIPIPVASNIEFCVQRHIGILRPWPQIGASFLTRFLESGFAFQQADRCATGIAQRTIPLSGLRNLKVPLPPLAEQHRIVAKVDELMCLCDRLEVARTGREATRDQLAAASLARLITPEVHALRPTASAPNPLQNTPRRTATLVPTSASLREAGDSFAADARFFLEALPALTTRPNQINALRQTIINLAITGRLTAHWRDQNPHGEEAAQIVGELGEAHRINGGHRRGNAAFATEGAHDLEFEQLPSTWSLTDLKSAVRPDRPITYGILMPGPDTPEGVPYVRVADFPGDQLNLHSIKRAAREIEQKYARARLSPNDILLSIRGTVGRTCLVPVELNGANITQDTARISLQEKLDRDFILMVLRAPSTQLRMRNCSKGVAVRGINIGDVRAIQLPVPPLAEQRQIVAKVNELMTLCDKLEASLTTAADTRRRLLDALLAEALAPDEDRLLEAAE